MKEQELEVRQDNKVDHSLYESLQRELDHTKAELDLFKQRVKLVGVRWYGAGGVTVGLSNPVGGRTRLALDARTGVIKGAIDYATWIRIRDDEHAQDGLIVRDDTVIDEMHMVGVKAEADEHRNSPNSYTDAEVIELLKGKRPDLERAINPMTSHWGTNHFLKVADAIEFADHTKLRIIKDKHNYLFERFNLELLHDHDLEIACKINRVPFEDRDREEVIDDLLNIKLKYIKETER